MCGLTRDVALAVHEPGVLDRAAIAGSEAAQLRAFLIHGVAADRALALLLLPFPPLQLRAVHRRAPLKMHQTGVKPASELNEKHVE